MTAKGLPPDAPSYYELGQLAIDSFMTLDRLVGMPKTSLRDFKLCMNFYAELISRVREIPADLLNNWINEFAEKLCSLQGIELSDESRESINQAFSKLKQSQEEGSDDESS